jgi:competence protein ComEC
VLFWAGRKLRVARVYGVVLTLALLLAYVSVVEQRAPVLRAALMAAIVVVGGVFFRRLELLNSAALAALILLVARPLALRDSSFQLSFLAVGCIAGVAIPWLERTVQPYARALRGWRDVTRDVAHEPRPTQFRIDVRSLAQVIEARLAGRMATIPGTLMIGGLGLSFRVWELFMLTLVLQIGMMPLLASGFHRITFAGPFVNFAAVPLTAVIVPLGFFTLIIGLSLPAVGKVLAAVLSWVVLALLHVVQRFAEVQKFSYRIPEPPLWVVVTFLVALVGIMLCLRVEQLRGRIVLGCLTGTLAVSGAIIAVCPFAARHAGGALEVSVLDVGQGDSLFVVSPGGKTLLIDGGGAFGGFPGQEQARGSDPGEEAVSPYLWSRGFKKIDVVALTHAHQDHLGGLSAILENFRVGQLWIGREVKSAAQAKLESLAREKHIPIEYESKGKSFSLDVVEGQFLWPTLSDDSGVAAKNNDSLVLRLKFRDRTLLLPGDAEKQAEHAMLAENYEDNLHADVLKVGHHGSKNSTTEEFLRAVRPRIAIISAGEDNPYGHPSPELLERLETARARVLRTDRDGAVHVVTDGTKMEVSCFVACPEATTVVASGSAHVPNKNQDKQQ